MLLFSHGSGATEFSPGDLRNALSTSLDQLGARRRVLVVPPDFTRCHSQSGVLTEMAWQYYGHCLTDVLPATGTHRAMSDEEIRIMFGKVPRALFRMHDWRNGLTTLGEVPSGFVRTVSEGKLDYGIPIQINKLLAEGSHDLILSIGQIVPHEVIGMAGHNKNIFVGTGGAEGIDKTHFLGAVYGIERTMGRIDTPVRRVLNYASEHFAAHLPILYVLTVVGNDDRGKPVIRGLFIGDTVECFHHAAALSLSTNVELLQEPIQKAVVYLDPSEFKSTWLGNKSIYRTRMALAEGAEIIVLAPGLARFGEDDEVDRLIRKYGYTGTPAVLELVQAQKDLQRSLGTAAHLIHGSSEGRFTVTYSPGHLTPDEIQGVNFCYGDLAILMKRYRPELLKDGMNTMADGEKVFFISNPALGLWACRDRFNNGIDDWPIGRQS